MLQRLKAFFAKPRNRAIVAILTAAIVGALCRFLPPALQGPCHACAKVIGIFGGGGP